MSSFWGIVFYIRKRILLGSTTKSAAHMMLHCQGNCTDMWLAAMLRVLGRQVQHGCAIETLQRHERDVRSLEQR